MNKFLLFFPVLEYIPFIQLIFLNVVQNTNI